MPFANNFLMQLLQHKYQLYIDTSLTTILYHSKKALQLLSMPLYPAFAFRLTRLLVLYYEKIIFQFFGIFYKKVGLFLSLLVLKIADGFHRSLNPNVWKQNLNITMKLSLS